MIKMVYFIVSLVNLGLVIHRAKSSKKEVLGVTGISCLLTALVYVLAKCKRMKEEKGED